MAIAANNCDMYEYEEVEESEGCQLAKKIGAIFEKTSKEGPGIDLLFKKIGKKFINTFRNENKNINDKNIQINSSSFGLIKVKNVSSSKPDFKIKLIKFYSK